MELEWAGIPSVAVVHESMEGTARAMARVSGMPEYGFETASYGRGTKGVHAQDDTCVDICRAIVGMVVSVIEETDTRDGKVVDIYRMTVSADGKTMTVVDKDVRRGTTSQYKMVKQP